MADYATYDEVKQAAATAQEIRDLARNVAAEALTGRASDANPTTLGWPLWSGVVVKGNTEPLSAPAKFGWWHYMRSLVLRLDGEVVEFRVARCDLPTTTTARWNSVSLAMRPCSTRTSCSGSGANTSMKLRPAG